MSEDAPGYSKNVLPPGTVPALATDEPNTNRKIDSNDGVTMPAVMRKNGWVNGQTVSYWDFGTSKRNGTPVYGIANCGGQAPVQLEGSLLIFDSIPGDSDYSPFRTVYWGCRTDKYPGNVIASLDAFNDAIDLGWITDPTSQMVTSFVNLPIVMPNVALAAPAGNVDPSFGYYRNQRVAYHELQPLESPLPLTMGSVAAPYVYEIVRPGSAAAARVIFSQPSVSADGTPNPAYTASWVVVTVTLLRPANIARSDTAALNEYYMQTIAGFTKESDMVMVGMNNQLMNLKPDVIDTIAATTNRVNRPLVPSNGGGAP